MLPAGFAGAACEPLIATCRPHRDDLRPFITTGVGLTIDNLLAAEVGTASGEIVTASAEENQDLFWALRGGGGNFGVATSFEYQAHPLSTVHGGVVAHPISRARQPFAFYRELTQAAPDELTVYFNFFADPAAPDSKLAAMIAWHCGDDPAAGEKDLKPLRDFGPPAADLIQPMPCPVINTLNDAGYPKGAFNYWKSAFLNEPSDAALEIMVQALQRSPSPMSGLGIVPYLGAVTRIDAAATALPTGHPATACRRKGTTAHKATRPPAQHWSPSGSTAKS